MSKLLDQNKRYRKMILEQNNKNTEVPDEDVIARCAELRVLIQQIAETHYRAETVQAEIWDPGFLTEEQKIFQQTLERTSSPDLWTHYIRTMIFSKIERMRLNPPINSEQELDRRRFEEAIKETGRATVSSLAKRRHRTIDCAEWLSIHSDLPKKTARHIVDLLQPWERTRTAEGPTVDQLEKSMLEVCEKAHSLSLLMRRGEMTNFRLHVYRIDTPIDDDVERDAITVGFEGREPEDEDPKVVVHTTVFGTLMKYVAGEPSGPSLPLERGEIIRARDFKDKNWRKATVEDADEDDEEKNHSYARNDGGQENLGYADI